MNKQKSMTGFEIELFTLNNEGHVTNSADILLKKAMDSKDFVIKKECAGNMIEIAAHPHEMVPRTIDNLLNGLEYLISIAKKENILLCPLGNYPGKFGPFMRDDKHYRIKQRIFGKKKFSIAGRCAGFHCHYTLPTGIFDSQLRILKMLTHSKVKDSLVNSYNMMIAADPALTTLTQSSPFYQGQFLGKDSRVIMYRGGPSLKNTTGLYSDFQEFGGLPHYKMTAFDINEIITTRYDTWKSYIKELGINVKVLPLYGSILNTNWAPLKISPHGTLEIRGMDMNNPATIAGIGVMIKFILKKLQEEFYTVLHSEIGIKEPFKIEKDVIYIPPYSFVRDELQMLAAYEGLDSDIVYNYCRRFVNLAESVMLKDRISLIKPIKKMLDQRRTLSDEILDYTKKKGYKTGEAIPDKLGADIAIRYSKKLLKNIAATRDMIKDLI